MVSPKVGVYAPSALSVPSARASTVTVLLAVYFPVVKLDEMTVAALLVGAQALRAVGVRNWRAESSVEGSPQFASRNVLTIVRGSAPFNGPGTWFASPPTPIDLTVCGDDEVGTPLQAVDTSARIARRAAQPQAPDRLTTSPRPDRRPRPGPAA